MAEPDITTYLQDRVGKHLRGVLRYHQDTLDLLYLRDDVREVRLESQFDRMVDRLEPESHSAEERAFPLGDLYVTVRRFEEAIIMHFPTGNNRGIVVSLEPETARDFNTFTTECLKHINRD